MGKEEQLEVESDKISTRSEVGEDVGKAALDLEKSFFVWESLPRQTEIWKIKKRCTLGTAVAGGDEREDQQMWDEGWQSAKN